MPGIFPNTKLLAGEENDGLPLTVQPRAGCDAMYYNEKCTQKPDYKALNALLSEIVSIINACPTSRYDCSSRANLLAALDCLYALPGCPTTTDCYELQCNGGTVSWQPCEVMPDVPDIPDPPAAGCYELKSNNGVTAWEACPSSSAVSEMEFFVSVSPVAGSGYTNADPVFPGPSVGGTYTVFNLGSIVLSNGSMFWKAQQGMPALVVGDQYVFKGVTGAIPDFNTADFYYVGAFTKV